MDIKDLKKIIDDDDLELLKVKPRSSPIEQGEERLISSFQEINAFVTEKGREPDANANDVKEFQLHSRLIGIREDEAKIEKLMPFDEHGLLKNLVKIETIGDIFDNDDLGLLDDGQDSIFKIRNVPTSINMPDEIARRIRCKDFEKFEPLLRKCQSELTLGKRKLLPFSKEQQISAGFFFVLKGILLFVEDVGKKETVNNRTNARLRCIFENGTESNMLLRSLASELYKNGRRVSHNEENLLDELKGITSEDEDTGYIYVLKSKSESPDIKAYQDLYKVGYSTIPVEQRVRGAELEPTYLMASVTIVSVYQCYNLNPQKLELLLHKFFGSACLNIDIFDNSGQRHSPREWFVAPLDVIEQAIYYILNGDIVNFKYDNDRKEIVGR